MEMADNIPGWALVLGVVVTGIASAVLGWASKRGGDAPPTRTSMSGAAIIDSTAVQGVVQAIEHLTGSNNRKVDVQVRQAMALERQAKAIEEMLDRQIERDKRESEERYGSVIETLKREIDDLKRGKR